MKELVFRPLKASEIECRVGATSKDDSGKVTAFTLLLYKNARADANVLDETVGAFNWQKKFYQVKNTMICSLGINLNYDDPSKEPYWVWKDDAGDDDFQTEKVKGEASDSFKRAAFAFGIARELYDSPDIWINVKGANNHKSYYSVKEIEYDKKKKITKLVIINSKTKEEVFSWQNGRKVATTTKVEEKVEESKPVQQDGGKGSIRQEERLLIESYMLNLTADKSQQFLEWLDKHFKTSQVENLSDLQGVIVCKKLGLL